MWLTLCRIIPLELQLGRDFWSAATPAGVTLVPLTFNDVRSRHFSSGDKSGNGSFFAIQ